MHQRRGVTQARGYEPVEPVVVHVQDFQLGEIGYGLAGDVVADEVVAQVDLSQGIYQPYRRVDEPAQPPVIHVDVRHAVPALAPYTPPRHLARLVALPPAHHPVRVARETSAQLAKRVRVRLIRLDVVERVVVWIVQVHLTVHRGDQRGDRQQTRRQPHGPTPLLRLCAFNLWLRSVP